MRREGMRRSLYRRWTSFGTHCLGWEYWPREIWNSMLNTVARTESNKLEPNIFHKNGVKMLAVLENNFVPVNLAREDRRATAFDIRAFLQLVDDNFLPEDAYMATFVTVLQTFVMGLLVRTACRNTLAASEAAIREQAVNPKDDMVMQPADALRIDCPIMRISRLQALLTFLKVVRPAAGMTVNPGKPLPEARLDFIKLVNTAINALLFEEGTRQQVIAMLCLVALINKMQPSMERVYLRVAQKFII